MVQQITIFLIGFTILASIILLVAYLFFLPDMRKNAGSKMACLIMLATLSGLQWHHYQYFSWGVEVLDSRFYLALLLMAPPAFYAFSRVVLFVDERDNWTTWLHFGWVLIAPIQPVDNIPVIAFVVGTGYTFWFSRVVYGLRDQRAHFQFEMFFFGMFALMALLALLLGLSLPFINHEFFYTSYASSIGIAMVFVVGALVIFPDLVNDIMVITERAYAKSKLGGVDIDAAQSRLEELMFTDNVYQNENLGLAALAGLVNLTSHQLSELINTRYGMGFPRYIRERRVEAAKKLLVAEPNTSILAISMMTGFKSQSNFYTAFNQATGESPGSFRSKKLS